MKNRNVLLWFFTLIIFSFSAYLIIDKEQLIANGRTLYLELAPVDPRSLIQGDYMRLRYAIVSDRNLPERGALVIHIDNNNVGQFVRLHNPSTTLAENEYLLKFRYRNRWEGVLIGAQSFLFQEGQAQEFDKAEYAELRLTPDGTVILVAMRDQSFNLLGEVQR